MTENLNSSMSELQDAELDAVTGGSSGWDGGSCINIYGNISSHLSENRWLPGGVDHQPQPRWV